MAEPTPEKVEKSAAEQVLERIGVLETTVNDALKPQYKGKTPALLGGDPANPARAPYGTSGDVGESQGYSLLKAAAFAVGFYRDDPSQCKTEIDMSNRLSELYKGYGFRSHMQAGCGSFLVPYNTAAIPRWEPKGQALVVELKQMLQATVEKFDADEARWLTKKVGGSYGARMEKTLGTISDAAGGVLVGFPTLGELVDLQRNREVFTNAGAQEIAMPPNGRIQFPKLTGGATSYWVGEGATISTSNQSTGYLDLVAKKLAVLVPINNELLRFNTISAEGMVRMDIARVAALKADLGMLEGTGGTQILGLINYPTTSAWTTGTDKVILHVAGTTGTDGNTFTPEDVATMEAKLPDAVDEPSSWVMRKNFFDKIMNRRADSVTTGDGKGPFMFWISRGDVSSRPPLELWGTKVVRSSQVSNTRAKGSGTTLTYVLLGYFPDWIIARSGVLEFLASNVSDTALTNDQTFLRGIQHIDAGARHAASFVMCDTLSVA